MRGFSVDRRGLYASQGAKLDLFPTDPFSRPIFSVEGMFPAKDISDLIERDFPEGLSPHGWHYLLTKIGFTPFQGAIWIDHAHQVEILFESVRRANFKNRPSRLQSYFAWQSLVEATSFRQKNHPNFPIYEIETDGAFLADAKWLSTGAQGAAAWLLAERYWSGAPTSSPEWEIVMPTPVTVVRLVEETPL